MEKSANNFQQRLAKKNIEENFQFILFGGTGDLAHNKIIPAFYNLVAKDRLPEDFIIIATGRRYNSEADYLDALYKSLQNKKEKIDNRIWQTLIQKIKYFELSFTEDEDYQKLADLLARVSQGKSISERIFYLATVPKFFTTIAANLKKHQLINTDFANNESRLVIEKPFGHDFESAEKLNNTLTSIFKEENIFRIDHYLGKEMIQNLMVLRLSNPIFRSIWNRENIDNIQIYLNESEGVKDRGKYYDDTGVIKDMFQNHILQILSLITMEEPQNLSSKEISQKKVEIFKKLADSDLTNIDKNIVQGQYNSNQLGRQKINSYLQEKDIAPDSKTPTFLALKLFINNERWRDVPIYLKSGKRLNEKQAAIALEFKNDFHPVYLENSDLDSNLLIIKIQPEEGVVLKFNTRKPGGGNKAIPVKMDFCQNCQQSFNSPENYEVLIHDMIIGDKTLFTSWQEVSYSWKFIDQILEKIKEEDIKVNKYPAFSNGPKAADKLLNKDGRHWWDNI